METAKAYLLDVNESKGATSSDAVSVHCSHWDMQKNNCCHGQVDWIQGGWYKECQGESHVAEDRMK
eukprot:10112504-Ditylum_brightwellii.AAC.1